MTAQVVALYPIGDQADDTIRRTIDAMAAGRGLTRENIADAIGMPRSTFYRKMAAKGSKNPLTAGEVASVARVLNVSVGRLYDGMGGELVPPPTDGGTSLPRLDSNQQPSGYRSPQVAPLYAHEIAAAA